MRAVLCYEVTDRDGEAKMKAGIKEISAIKKTKEPASRATFGLPASLTLSDALVRLMPPSHP
ncbi:MAG: hypothetical protein U0X92_03740 [Anaerolineales bacterium]